MEENNNNRVRRGIRDLWNSALYEGAEWTELDNPVVHSTASEFPKAVMLWDDAKRLHRQKIAFGDGGYHTDAFIHCYTDDQDFDGPHEGIWRQWKVFYEVAAHFDGIMGVDFSTYADMPEPLKRYQFHKMRAIEFGAIRRGIAVLPNARWGTRETWSYCFDALPEEGMLSVGTVGSGLRLLENRFVFDEGLRKLVELKRPRCLVVVGSANYPSFDEARERGVEVVQFPSETSAHFSEKGGRHV